MEQSHVPFPEAIRAPALGVKLSAVIPVWNGRHYLERLLDTIALQTLPFDEVVVVDNGSADGAGDLAQSRGAVVVRFAENLGFAVAVNRGVAESRGDLIAVLNSDVELATDWAEILAAALGTGANFAAGRIVSAVCPNRIDGTWDLVSEAGMAWRAGHGTEADHPAFQQSQAIQLASFTAILFHRELWTRVGPLDERFESYLEDVDFGIRCAVAGLVGRYEPAAVCSHHGSAALGRWNPETVRRMSRNQVYLVRKHLAPGWWNLLIGQGLWGLVAWRHGTGWAWLKGKVEGVRQYRSFSRAALFESQDDQIFTLQSRLGFDSYWKWYQRLRLNDTGAGHE